LHDPYATGVLHEAHHSRLVADLDRFAADAGIQPRWLWQSMIGVCSSEEIEFFKAFHRNRVEGNKIGLCYVGKKFDPHVDTRMASMTAALVRNFVRARIMTVGDVLDILKDNDRPEATCLLIPNFFFSKTEGGDVASWRTAALLDMLYNRQMSGLHTVIAVSSIKLLASEYGEQFGSFIDEHFLKITP
jgi:hypothetical protein